MHDLHVNHTAVYTDGFLCPNYAEGKGGKNVQGSPSPVWVNKSAVTEIA